jgi:F-type H+-transporting ATPase subunit epsilon
MSFQVSVVTPEQAVLECEARSVVFPAHDGQMGILTNRAPLLCQLGVGPLRVDEDGGTSHVLVIDGGFAQMVENRLTILTESAQAGTEVDRETAQEALKEAMTREVHGEAEQAARQRDIERARNQLKISG